MSSILPQKRSAVDPPTDSNKNTNSRYNRLLSILTKALTQSREKVASEASQTIKDSYGDMTSLFTSAEDSDGVSSLVDLLLGKLDVVHDRFNSEKTATASTSSSEKITQLDKILQDQHIQEILTKLEVAISTVEAEEEAFKTAEETDKKLTKDAIKLAKVSTRITSPTTNKRTKISPGESIGYTAYQMKLDYQNTLLKELDSIEKENELLEGELRSMWVGWQDNVEKVKGSLVTLDSSLGVDGK